MNPCHLHHTSALQSGDFFGEGVVLLAQVEYGMNFREAGFAPEEQLPVGVSCAVSGAGLFQFTEFT